MQRSPVASLPDLRLRFFRRLESRLGGHGDISVDQRFRLLDPLQTFPGEFDRRNLFASQ